MRNTFVLMLLLAFEAHAAIRVYEAPARPLVAEPQEQRTVDEQEAFRAKVDGMWNELVVKEIQKEEKSGDFVVYFHSMDIGASVVESFQKLKDMPELQRLGLTPTLMQNDVKIDQYVDLYARNPEYGALEGDIYIDYANDYGLAHGITNRSTIIYRDPTGAVRLYGLAHELDRFQRQLQRQLEGR